MAFLLGDPETRIHRGFVYDYDLLATLTFGFIVELDEPLTITRIKFCLYLLTINSKFDIQNNIRPKAKINLNINKRLSLQLTVKSC